MSDRTKAEEYQVFLAMMEESFKTVIREQERTVQESERERDTELDGKSPR